VSIVVAVFLGGAALLALTRFRAYVLLMLGVRPCVDLFKGGERLTGATTLLAVLFLVLAGLWLAARLRSAGTLRGSPLGTALLLVAATAGVSALGSAHPGASVPEVLRILTVVTMFVVLEQLLPEHHLTHRVLVACYAALALALAYTLALTFLGHPPSEVKGSFTRVSGPFSQSTTFGRYLMFLVVFGCGIHRFTPRRWRAGLTVLLGLSMALLAATNTRSAIIGTALGLLVVAILHRSAALLALLCVAALGTVLLLPAVADRFAQLGETRAAGAGPTGNTLAWRVDYWVEIVDLADRNPVTGIGPNVTARETAEAKRPHNDALRAYVETGVLGLLAYLAMLGACLHTARQALRRAPPGTSARGIAVGFAGCAVAFVAVSAVSNVVSNVVTMWYFVAFAALASAVSNATTPTETDSSGDRGLPARRA
jgi:putative inorganic carbon (HCO3(-)) transporter